MTIAFASLSFLTRVPSCDAWVGQDPFNARMLWGLAWYRLVGTLRGNGLTYSPRAASDAMRHYEREECKRRARERD